MPDQTLTAEQKAILAEAQQYGGTLAPTSAAPITNEFQPAPTASFLSSAMNFTKNFAAGVNPLPVLKQLYDDTMHPTAESSGESALLGPLGPMAVRIGKAQVEQFKKAKDAYDQGRMSEAVGHTIAGALPLVGPAAANVGEQIGSGDISGGLGSAAALLAPSAGAAVAPAIAARVGGAMETAAPIVNDVARQNIIGAMTPPSNVRIGNMAAKAADSVARNPEMSGVTKSGLQQTIDATADAKLADLNAIHAPIADEVVPLQPLKDALKAKQDQLVVRGQNVEGPPGMQTRQGTSTTADSVSDQADAIQSALDSVNKLGKQTTMGELRKLKAQWQDGAKAIYLQATSPDILKAQGPAKGYASAASAADDIMLAQHPELGPANAAYSLARSAQDAMKAAQERAQVTSSSHGPQLGAAAGAIIGGATGGGLAGELMGGGIGTVLGWVADQGSKMGLTPQIKIGQNLASFADYLRQGKTALAQSALLQAAQAAGVTVPPVVLSQLSTPKKVQ